MTYGVNAHLGLFLLGVSCIAGPARAQRAISLGDSVTRRITPHSVDSALVFALRDGDYARFVVTHPAGIAINVIRPNRTRVTPFISPDDPQGTDPVEFVAEGAGPYAVEVTNAGDVGVQYTVAFQERRSLDDRTRPGAWRDAVPSPRIQAIHRQVDSAHTNTADFWSAVAKEGTPLVEPFDASYDLVTFLWRAENDTRNVYLVGSLGVPEGPNDALHQLGSTDIWYLTLPLPKGARFSYRLEPNRPSVPGMEQVTLQMDPFNRGVKWDCPSGASKYQCRSVGELPDAPAQPWMANRRGVAAGRIEKQTIHSALQNVDRDLTVYTPAGYAAAGKAASLVVLFDGDEYLDSTWHGPDTWDNLISAGKIPPTVVVMVDNLPNRRLFDLVANPTFGDFMAKELAPWVRSHYNVSHEPSRTVIGGASAGGFGATYLGLAHPEVFGNVLSMSGAFWWSPEHNGGICAGACEDPAGKPAVSNRDGTTEPNWIAQLALNRPAAPVRFYLAAGTFEFDRDGTAGGLLEETRHLRDILRAKNYQVIYQQFVGGHDGLSWPGVMADGLQSLLGASR
jgi:enterochelin esterase-like enzyme